MDNQSDERVTQQKLALSSTSIVTNTNTVITMSDKGTNNNDQVITKELIIESCGSKSFVEVARHHVLTDVRSTIMNELDEDQIPDQGNFYFCVNGIRLSSKQEGRKKAWDLRDVSIHSRSKKQKVNNGTTVMVAAVSQDQTNDSSSCFKMPSNVQDDLAAQDCDDTTVEPTTEDDGTNATTTSDDDTETPRRLLNFDAGAEAPAESTICAEKPGDKNDNVATNETAVPLMESADGNVDNGSVDTVDFPMDIDEAYLQEAYCEPQETAINLERNDTTDARHNIVPTGSSNALKTTPASIVPKDNGERINTTGAPHRKGNGNEPQTWPLARKVALQGPGMALSTGAYHYSPQVQDPTGTRHPSVDVNVISPAHRKATDSRPPRNSGQARPPPQYYQYSLTSPKSRPGTNPYSRNASPRKNHSSRPEGPYTATESSGGNQAYHPDDDTWTSYPSAASSGTHSPLVTESSFDSEHYSSSQYSSHPRAPDGGGQPMTPGSLHGPNQFYGGGSWGSFDSTGGGGGGPPHPQFDDQRYYAFPPSFPYAPYSAEGAVGYYGKPVPGYSRGPPLGQPYDSVDAYHHQHYQQHQEHHDSYKAATVTSGDNQRSFNPSSQTDSTRVQYNRSNSGMLLPRAAYEVDFDVAAPPCYPILPPSQYPMCHSPAEIRKNDVLSGRGGRTNSKVGNRRFRKLVQEFQPRYLLARKKEKHLLARTIVLIIRKRGGRFLKENEGTKEFYEVGDAKAEAKTVQALRQGLGVRATKSAANSLLDNAKKKEGFGKDKEGSTSDKDSPMEDELPKEKKSHKDLKEKGDQERTKTPPPHIPAVKKGQCVVSGITHPPSPHSPEALQFRKRRRMRSEEGLISLADKQFRDFCPPRADLCRANGPTPMNSGTTPPLCNGGSVGNDQQPGGCNPGCTGIAIERSVPQTGSGGSQRSPTGCSNHAVARQL